MDERALLARYAATALLPIAGVEWLLGRTVSRMAAAPTLEGLPRTIVEVLGRTGIFVLSTSFLLAASLVCLSALSFGARASQERRPLMLALAYFLPLFTAFAIAHSFLETQIWVNVVFNILALVAMWWVTLSFVMNREVTVEARIAVLLVALAWSGWYYYVLGALLEGAVFLLNLGEMIAVAAVFVLFAAIAVPGGEWRHLRRWVAPALLTVLFSIGNIADMIADQGFMGVFTTWSVGFNLFLPWPLYAVALALFTYSVLTCFSKRQSENSAQRLKSRARQEQSPPTRTIHQSPKGDFVQCSPRLQSLGGEHGPSFQTVSKRQGKSAYANANTGLGLLLIVFAGYNLQLPYQHLLAVLSLMLLSGLACPFGTMECSTQTERRVGTPQVLS